MKIVIKVVLLTSVLGLLGIQSALLADTKMSQDPPNILFIIVDDLGYADFEPFNHHAEDIRTPNMTRLADDGVVFTQAYVTGPVCSPSRAGMNTGKFQFRWDKKASWMPGLPDNVKTLAEYLQEAGYHTVKIGKSDLGGNYHKYDVREHPNNHGYDEFLGFNAHAHDYWLSSAEIRDRTPDPYNPSAHLGPLMHNQEEKSVESGYMTDIFTEAAVKFLMQKQDKPFFLSLSYNAVHALIHQVPQKYLDKYGLDPIPNYDPDAGVECMDRMPGSYAAYFYKYLSIGDLIDHDVLRKYYLANLECLDDGIGRVLDTLEKNGLKKETVVVFMSDNGGVNLVGSNNAPLSGTKFALLEGGIRIPMMMSWPGTMSEGKTLESIVSTTDILPTLTEIAGIKIKDKSLDGISLTESLLNKKEISDERVLVWKWHKNFAIRKGDWKLTNSNDEWGPSWTNHTKFYQKPISDDNSLKLFNLNDDISERNNLVDFHPDKVQELQVAYMEWGENNIGKY
jgi:arylsulfatase A-like enzyme